MSVFHGTPGLRSGRRTFADLVYDSAARRQQFVDLELGKEVTGWNDQGGSVWKALVHEVADGMLLDVVSVEVGIDTTGPFTLTRMEQLSDLANGPGFWTTIESATLGDETMDSGMPGDEPAPVGDEFPPLELYVRLPGDVNAGAAYVLALLMLRFSTTGEVHPVMGPEKFGNPDLELSGFPSPWGAVTLNGSQTSPPTLFQDLVVVASGSSAARIEGSFEHNRGRGLQQGSACLAGKSYIVGFYYMTEADQHPALEPRLHVSTGSVEMLPDGRTTQTQVSGFRLEDTFGEWRYTYFEWICPTTGSWTATPNLYNGGGGLIAGKIWLDRLTFRRVLRHEQWQARMRLGARLPLELGTQSYFWQEKPIGLGDLVLVNRDRKLYSILGRFRTSNRRVTVRVGGRFGDGQELPATDWRAQFPGITRTWRASDEAVRINVEDRRGRLHRPFPITTIDRIRYPLADARILGRPAPCTVAFAPAIPLRIDRNANGYGIYLLSDRALGDVDNTGAPFDGMWTHPNEAQAQLEQNLFFLTLGTHWRYVPGSGNTKVEILTDVRDLQFTRDGTQIGNGATWDFDVGGSILTAITNMQGPIVGVCATLQAAMRAVPSSAADIEITFDEVTKKPRSRRSGGGTFRLRGETGPNASFNYWKHLGYSSGDKTVGNDYTAENPTFTDADRDHCVRILAYGLVDADGLATGSFGALIKKHAHFLRWGLLKLMGQTIDQVDAFTFDAAAALETGLSGVNNDHMWLWENEYTNTAELFGRIERTMMGDLVTDGEGVSRFLIHELETRIIAEFTDRDYLSFEMFDDPTQLYARVRVEHAFSAPRARAEHIELFDPRAAIFDGATQTLSLRTTSASSSRDPSHRPMRVANRHLRLATARPRGVIFTVAGRLVEGLPGRLVKLTRTGAVDPSGNLTAVTFRIRKLTADMNGGTFQCFAVEHVSLESN